jgi:hypothetical protein
MSGLCQLADILGFGIRLVPEALDFRHPRRPNPTTKD